MVINISNLNQFTEQLSLDKILNGDLSSLVSLFYLAIYIAIYSIII